MSHDSLSIEFNFCRSIDTVKFKVYALLFYVEIRFGKLLFIKACSSAVVIAAVLTVNVVPRMGEIKYGLHTIQISKLPLLVQIDNMTHLFTSFRFSMPESDRCLRFPGINGDFSDEECRCSQSAESDESRVKAMLFVDAHENIYHIPIAFEIIITLLGWLDKGILQAYEFNILCIAGALGTIFSIAIMRTLFWLKEQMRIFYENKYSNEEEFPNNFAKDITPRIIIMLPIIWLTFITKNHYIMGGAFFVIAAAYVFFLNYVLDSHIQPIPEEYQPKNAVNPVTEADEMTESLTEDEGIATKPNEGFEVQLQQLMENDKPYLNPSLTIMELARMLNTNVPTLRNVSKLKYGSFIKMVNSYRLAHAKVLHKEHPEYSKQAIAEDSGFGSYRSLLRAEKAENE